MSNSNSCKWEYEKYEDAWYTECGEIFQIVNGTPQDNNMKYCTYCGKEIEESKID